MSNWDPRTIRRPSDGDTSPVGAHAELAQDRAPSPYRVGVGMPKTVGEYIEGFTGPSREILEQLRALAREAVPEASEAIKWGCPAWLHPSGTILFMVSGHAKHASVAFTPSTRGTFTRSLEGFDAGKGTIKLPYGQPVPVGLLRRMIAFRVREHEDEGVLWM